MAISIALPAIYAPMISPLLFAIPGAVAGFMASIAIVGVMDRPNRETAEMEWKDKHDQNKHDVA